MCLALLYKDVSFRIDARSDLDSQGRFSRGEVILVGINLSRHWFRMDLSFNQFSTNFRILLVYMPNGLAFEILNIILRNPVRSLGF